MFNTECDSCRSVMNGDCSRTFCSSPKVVEGVVTGGITFLAQDGSWRSISRGLENIQFYIPLPVGRNHALSMPAVWREVWHICTYVRRICAHKTGKPKNCSSSLHEADR